MKYFIFLLIIIASCQSSSYLETTLDLGMTQEQVIAKLGSPNDIVTSTTGDSFVYYHYDTWAGWQPTWGKKYLLFDEKGKLRQIMGTGYYGTKK